MCKVSRIAIAVSSLQAHRRGGPASRVTRAEVSVEGEDQESDPGTHTARDFPGRHRAAR
jgi:hypothetical protein